MQRKYFNPKTLINLGKIDDLKRASATSRDKDHSDRCKEEEKSERSRSYSSSLENERREYSEINENLIDREVITDENLLNEIPEDVSVVEVI